MGNLWNDFALRGRSLLIAALVMGGSSISEARGCTIFVLTDGERTLFFNNEDWSNPVSRVWFVPAPEGYYSCAYVGFENNGAEGGMNSAGLAFDWVAGFSETWTPYANMQPVGGRTSERMLETCATVEEAIAFYEKYREPQFHRAKILVADKTGASAIIGAKDGRLQIDRANHSRGFGYGRRTLATMLKTNTEPRIEIGREILQACEQKGQYATKYSSIFDLKNGEIMIVAAGSDEVVKIDLQAELKRGAHYYDIPEIRAQLDAAPRPALSNMRSFLREYTPVEGASSEITETIVAVMRRGASGKLRRTDFTAEFWRTIEPIRGAIRADLLPFGGLLSVVAVENTREPSQKNLYKLEFKNAWVLGHFESDSKGKIASLRTLGTEWKHPPAGARNAKQLSLQ